MLLLQQQHLILKVIMVVDHPIMRIFMVMLFGVNLEYLGRVVFYTNGILYPDSVVGTDSHTTMIAGLGVVGWGVGGIEYEATMFGQTCMKWVAVFSYFSSKGAKENTASASPKPDVADDSNCKVRNFLERCKIWSKN